MGYVFYYIFNRSSLLYDQFASYVNVCNVAGTVMTVPVFFNFFYTWAKRGWGHVPLCLPPGSATGNSVISCDHITKTTTYYIGNFGIAQMYKSQCQ